MKIAKVTIRVGEGRTKYSTSEIECEETLNSYKWQRNQLKKSSFMRVDSLFRNDRPAYFHYFIYCLPENIEVAHDMLYSTCKEKIVEFETAIELLKKSLTTP